MDLPRRKSNRLNGYDYSLCGAYFVTICVANKEAVLWESVGANCVRPRDRLSDIGKIIDDEIQKLNSIYDNVALGEYCIMPDHIHLIVFISDDESGRPQVAPILSRIVKQFKGSVTKKLGFCIWQKSFYDKIIRNEKGYREVVEYIRRNPQKCDN